MTTRAVVSGTGSASVIAVLAAAVDAGAVVDALNDRLATSGARRCVTSRAVVDGFAVTQVSVEGSEGRADAVRTALLAAADVLGVPGDDLLEPAGWPPGAVDIVGSGRGADAAAPHAGIAQVVVIRPALATPRPHAPLVVAGAMTGDLGPRACQHLVDELLAAGARDAWLTAVVSTGPTFVVRALVDASSLPRCTTLLAARGLSVTVEQIERVSTHRDSTTASLDGARVRCKVGPYGAKPEFDDVASIARERGLPLRTVAERARDAWRRESGR